MGNINQKSIVIDMVWKNHTTVTVASDVGIVVMTITSVAAINVQKSSVCSLGNC